MNRPIYLDYAAATPLDPAVKKSMQPYLDELFYNPSATYLAGRNVRQRLEAARKSVAKVLSVNAGEIYYTAGATEANNLAITGVLSQFPNAEILISALEHDSVFWPANLFKYQIYPVNKCGEIETKSLNRLISDQTVLISATMVSHELGTIQPLKEISQVIAKVRTSRLNRNISTPLYLHTDASQAANCLSLNLPKLGVDLATFNGGKLYGPKQSGALYIKKSVNVVGQIRGGGQERGLRSGTENVAGAVGFSTALTASQKQHKLEFERLKKLRIEFAKMLQNNKINFVINESNNHQSPHILSSTFPGTDNERLMMELDERGIICAVGSACSADSVEPSRILKAIGLSDTEARSTLRFSFGRQTTPDEIKQTVKILSQLTS